MRHGFAPVRTGQTKQAAQAVLSPAGALDQLQYHTHHDPRGQEHANRPNHAAPGLHGKCQPSDRDSQNKHIPQRDHRAHQPRALPGQNRPKRQHQPQRHHERREGRVKERRSDAQLAVKEHLGHQRPHGADKDHKAGHRQQHVVHHQSAFAAGQAEDALGFHNSRPEGEKDQSAPHEDAHDQQNPDTPFGVIGKSVHRRQKARAYNEGADQRKAKRQNGQQDCPAFQGLPLFHNDGRMQQRCSQQPWHERRIFNRVPEPEATPAQFVIGPP